MKTIKTGDLILQKYRVTALLDRSHIYQWLEAIDQETEQSKKIQLFLERFGAERFQSVFDYFDRLKNISHKIIIVPKQIWSNQDIPLGVIYDDFDDVPLSLSPTTDIEILIKTLHEATETIRILHNKELIHGGITPKSFVRKQNKVCLTGFGYAPILAIDKKNATKDLGDFLAPELVESSDFGSSSSNLVTPQIDIYAFAKTVAYWLPEITSSSWYLKATDPDPSQRFQRVRDLSHELEKALIDIFATETHEIETTDITDIIDRSDSLPSSSSPSKGGIIPKYLLQVRVLPSEAGRVEGGGHYSQGKEVQLEAIAFPDWRFIGWEGDIQQVENQLSLIVSRDLQLIARFEKIPKSSASIEVVISPPEAREFVNINGSGTYPLGTTVHLQASVNLPDRWRFVGWDGDFNGLNNPLIISASEDLNITAKFEAIPISSSPKSSPKKQIGIAFGSPKKQDDSLESFSQSSQQKTVGEAFRQDTDHSPKVTPQDTNQHSKTTIKLGSAFDSNKTEET